MDKQDIIYLSILIGSYVLAIFPAWKIWSSVKDKLSKSRFGRLFQTYGSSGTKSYLGIAFLIHALFWGVIAVILMLGYVLLFE